jgi:hypothetical protein
MRNILYERELDTEIHRDGGLKYFGVQQQLRQTPHLSTPE